MWAQNVYNSSLNFIKGFQSTIWILLEFISRWDSFSDHMIYKLAVKRLEKEPNPYEIDDGDF